MKNLYSNEEVEGKWISMQANPQLCKRQTEAANSVIDITYYFSLQFVLRSLAGTRV